jgi:hypothetical protein
MSARREVTTQGRWLDRRSAAAFVSLNYFPVTKRAIERWPLRGRLLNGRVLLREQDVVAYAEECLNSAPATAPLRR